MSNALDRSGKILFDGLIYTIRDQKVILDADLARVYGTTTKAFNQAFRRNSSRFPTDFVFHLTAEEASALPSLVPDGSGGPMRSHFVTAYRRNLRFRPYAFTEHGAVMASMILNNREAVAMSVFVVRAFIAMRRALGMHRELAARIDELEKKTDTQFKVVFDAIRELMAPDPVPRKQIGFTKE